MPKNAACPGVPRVSDPITDQEIAFARLILFGAMTDRRAAEAVGLNPDTAAYTKAKPRVRAYMIEHRAAVREKLVDQEADLSRLPRPAVGRAVEGLQKLNIGRDQIMKRLWELAALSSEATRGSIAGQIKAIAMIVAIEGLIPSGTINSRRVPLSGTQSAPPPVNGQIHNSELFHEPQHQPVGVVPQVTKPDPAPEPAAKQVNHTSSPNLEPNPPSPVNPFDTESLIRLLDATDRVYDVVLDTPNSLKLSFSPDRRFAASRR